MQLPLLQKLERLASLAPQILQQLWQEEAGERSLPARREACSALLINEREVAAPRVAATESTFEWGAPVPWLISVCKAGAPCWKSYAWAGRSVSYQALHEVSVCSGLPSAMIDSELSQHEARKSAEVTFCND